MSDNEALFHIDSHIFQLTLEIRQLSQRKHEFDQKIKVCKGNITETNSYIETTKTNVKKLEEEIKMKLNTVNQNKSNVKSLKATYSLLQHYEKMLKSEQETRQENYNQDIKVYEERIANYKKLFHEHKEYYCQKPLAKKLLEVQAEKEMVACRIKACEDQITMRQKELDDLVGQTDNSASTDISPDSTAEQLIINEQETVHQAGEDIHSNIDLSSLQLTQTIDAHETSEKGNAQQIHEESIVRDTIFCPTLKESSNDLWSNLETADGNQRQQSDEMPSVDNNYGSGSEKQDEEGMKEEMAEGVVVCEEQMFVPDEEDIERSAALNKLSPQIANPQSPPARMKVISSTPTFSLNSSLGSSPERGSAAGRSPAFLFSVNPDSATQNFSGFGFNSNQEDSPFTFTSSYFSEKSSESKSPSGPQFLFDPTEIPEEEFKFSFDTRGQQNATTANQDKSTEDVFPFSFNFEKF